MYLTVKCHANNEIKIFIARENSQILVITLSVLQLNKILYKWDSTSNIK